ncbi:MAG: response regulator [Bdellovibrionota bacterium]
MKCLRQEGTLGIAPISLCIMEDTMELYPPSIPSNIDLTKPSVLAVEDNSLEAHLIVSTLEEDYNVFFASNGIDALKILKQHHIDCIVCDLLMPKMGGKTFLKCVQKYKKYREIPFLILTIKHDIEEVVSHLYLGAADYIPKPFHVDVLKARVHTNVQNSFLRRKLLTYGDSTYEGKFGYYRENELQQQSLVFDKLGKELNLITEVIDHLVSGINVWRMQQEENFCSEKICSKMCLRLHLKL